MKRLLSVIAITAIFASCGNGSDTTNNSDTTTKVGPDTSMMPADTNRVLPDTTHKDSVIH